MSGDSVFKLTWEYDYSQPTAPPSDADRWYHELWSRWREQNPQVLAQLDNDAPEVWLPAVDEETT